MQNLQLWEWGHLAVCQVVLALLKVCGLRRNKMQTSQNTIYMYLFQRAESTISGLLTLYFIFFYLYKNILKKRVIAGKEGLYITTKAVADIFMIHICQSWSELRFNLKYFAIQKRDVMDCCTAFSVTAQMQMQRICHRNTLNLIKSAKNDIQYLIFS